MKYAASILIVLTALGTFAQTPCENGLAAGYPCNQISLYAEVSPEELLGTEHQGYWTNDIWGWTDPGTEHEYALVGLTDGVAFVDVTIPGEPSVIGKLEETPGAGSRILHEKSTWRDLKVYENYLFVVSDRNDVHGMQIFDLTRLRAFDGSTPQYFEHDAEYTGISSVHNIAINEATGYAYIVGTYTGSNCIGGGLHIVDISDPLHPEFAGCFDDDGYTHDAQCVIYNGPDTRYQGKEICFNSNEDTFTIVDVDDKENMNMVSRTPYDRSRYAHQGWLSEDHRFFLMNDELDEYGHGFNPRTLIWNIEDMENPELIGEYYNEALAIDHNLYIHEGLVYESNYQSGLRVLDLARIEDGKMREVAFFDTYPEADAIEYGGTWSNYPFFESGTLIVSDMYRGLFILKLDRKDEVILKHPTDTVICEGEEVVLKVVTEGTDLNYQWQWFNGERFVNIEDDNLVSGTTTSTLTGSTEINLQQTPVRCKVIDTEGNIYYSFPAEMSVSPFPVADFNFTIEYNEETGLVSFTNNSMDAVSYLWQFDDGQTSTDEHPEYEFSHGTYSVRLIASNECGSDSLTRNISVVTGIDGQTIFSIHPNPSAEELFITAESPGILEIRDLTGRLLSRHTMQSGTNNLDLYVLDPGIYLATLITEKREITQRLIRH